MITAPAVNALDFRGSRPALGSDLTAARSIPWQTSVHTRLYRLGDGLLIAGRGEGLVEIGASDPTTWTRWNADMALVGPGWRSDPVIILASGSLVRVEAGGSLRRVLDAGAAGKNLAAVGLPDDRIVVTRYGDTGVTLELWQGQSSVWTRQGGGPDIVPHADYLLSLGTGLERISMKTGETAWSVESGAQAIAGVCDDTVWLRGDGQLLGLDAGSGATRHDIRLTNNRAAQGVLDELGRYHSTTGLRYQIYDLAHGGSTIADYPLTGATSASGNFGIVARDGCFAFADDAGRVFVFNPAPEELARVATFPPPVANFGIAHEGLWILTDDALHRFGAR
jgi:hypothetical protein